MDFFQALSLLSQCRDVLLKTTFKENTQQLFKCTFCLNSPSEKIIITQQKNAFEFNIIHAEKYIYRFC